MAFMMPVVKNEWDIYNSRKVSESERAGTGGRVRKVSESRSEGVGAGPRSHPALSPHRSAPAMRSLSYTRSPPSRASLRPQRDSPKTCTGSPTRAPPPDKFHSRLVEKLKRALGRSEERTS